MSAATHTIPGLLRAVIEDARKRARRRRVRTGLLFVAGIAGVMTFMSMNHRPARPAGESLGQQPIRLDRAAFPPLRHNGPLTLMTVLPTAGGIDGPEGWYGISSVGSTGGLRTLVRCPHRVRWCGDLESIDWSRDGTRLAFGVTSYGSKNPYNGLHVLNVRTGRDIKIVREGEHREYGWLDIDWAPGGRRLAYVTFGHIAIVNADGSERRILQTGTVGRDHSPSWSPDGRWIAFATTIDGATSVYAIRADGSGRRLLTRSGSTPAWSPDGSRIVFLRGGRVEYLTPAGRLLTPRLLGPIDVTAAVWSPDSKEIAMSTARRGTWVMNTDGTELRQVTRYSGDSVAGGQRQRPAWRPLR